VYAIEYAIGAEEDLAGIEPFHRNIILTSVDTQLAHVPNVRTRHRKPLEGLVPPFEHVPPIWQLSVGEYRVFYDVDEAGSRVVVRAVRRKPAHKTTKEIL
jgi:mRNA-degrading endonuclease RelE of RelBE toxin-antitoxin system